MTRASYFLFIHTLFLILIVPNTGFSQPSREIRGVVLDKESSQAVPGATLRVYPENLTFVADQEGKFQLNLPVSGKHRLAASHVGYETVLLEVAIPLDTLLEIRLAPFPISLDEIIVTATRSGIFGSDSPVSVERVSSSDLAKTNGSSLSSAVGRATGVFVKDYGGSLGLKTLSMRGMGAEHTMVLLDGIRLNNYQNGLVDFALWPMEQIERIEIVRGGISALYGADAVGGVLNLVPKYEVTKPSASISASIGSFGYQKYFFGVDHRLLGLSVRGSYSQEKGKNEFSFSPLFGNERDQWTRSNNDSHLEHGFLRLLYRVDDRSRLSATFRAMGSRRGLPGPAFGKVSGKARQDDHDVVGVLALQSALSHQLLADLSLNFHYSDLRYTDPALLVGGRFLESFSRTMSYGLSNVTQWQISERTAVATGGELTRAKGQSPDLITDFGRTLLSSFVSAEFSFTFGNSLFPKISFYPSLRYDRIVDGFGDQTTDRSAWSPKFGMNLKVIREWLAVRSSVGRSFRVPTFNDLYWSPGGNPALLPESSRSFDVGVEVRSSFAGKHRIEVNYFNIDTKNRIIWLPTTSADVWSPRNIGRTLSSGIEIGLRSSFLANRVEIGLSETRTDAAKKNRDGTNDPTFDKQSIYVPKEVTSFSITLHLAPIQVNLFHQYVSHRFYTETNDRFLPSYRITDANISASIDVGGAKITTKLEANNLFDKEYQVIAFYPQPPRSYRVTFGVTR